MIEVCKTQKKSVGSHMSMLGLADEPEHGNYRLFLQTVRTDDPT